MEESQRVDQRVLALVGEGVETPWPSLASFTLRPDPTSHAYLPPRSITSILCGSQLVIEQHSGLAR